MEIIDTVLAQITENQGAGSSMDKVAHPLEKVKLASQKYFG